MADKQETSEDIIAEMDRVEVCADGEPCLRDYARRFKAAWKREKSQSWHHREMEELILQHEKEVAELKKLIPKPDPDWKAICEKCHDGEIEPKCEYYGEPNGCNSPIYGEHPKASLGNNLAMREALATVIKIAAEMRGEYEIADSILKDGWATQLESIAKAALSIPARNCDRFQTKENAAMAFNKERSVFIPQSLLWQLGEWLDWLFTPAKEGGAK